MIVLLGFAVLAGAGTALSPCVLPVLPALLSAGGVGGRRRPLGIVLGLSITFTVTIVGVAKVVDGVGLGFVYTPCASPILAAVISVSAASGRTIAIACAYAIGSALVLLALTLGGRRVFERVRATGRGPVLQRALGAIMILTAVAIITMLDVSFDQFVARNIPDVNLAA